MFSLIYHTYVDHKANKSRRTGIPTQQNRECFLSLRCAERMKFCPQKCCLNAQRSAPPPITPQTKPLSMYTQIFLY